MTGRSTPPSSPPRSGARSSSKPTGGSSGIRYDDRIFVTGTSGCGKSTLSRALFLAAPAPRLVIDPNDSELTEVPGAVTFSDVGRATNRKGENWRQAATARFVPHDPEDRDTYDELYRWVFLMGQRHGVYRFTWCDEAGFVHPAQGMSPYSRKMFTQGRKFDLGMLVCHTRPREIDTNIVAQSPHVFVFDTPIKKDRLYIAENAGIEPDVFEAAHAELERYGFMHFDRRAKRLTISGPLREG